MGFKFYPVVVMSIEEVYLKDEQIRKRFEGEGSVEKNNFWNNANIARVQHVNFGI